MNSVSLIILCFYFLTVFNCYLYTLINQKIANIIAILIAFATFTVAALRPDNFPDVDTYELIYEFASTGDWDNPLYWLYHSEPGFKILSYLLSSIGFDYREFLCFFAYLSLLLLIYIAKISHSSFSLLWLAYFSCFFITRDLGVIRLAIASHLIVIFFISTSRIIRWVSILVATLSFQYFSFVVIFIKIISKVKINYISLGLLMITAALLANMLSFPGLEFVVPDKQFETYSNTDQVLSGGSAVIAPLMRNILFGLLLFIMLRTDMQAAHYRMLLWAVFASSAIYLAGSGILIVAQRFSAYYAAVIPIVVTYALEKHRVNHYRFNSIILFLVLNFLSLFAFNSFVWAS